ncbi:hypothetical protein DFJ73DRAFT_284561 [Zopfochytrium polystomum]|nr:hypothetical protein DFJ73DRAFT_284561 [Zopfochytrium polystomum]
MHSSEARYAVSQLMTSGRPSSHVMHWPPECVISSEKFGRRFCLPFSLSPIACFFLYMEVSVMFELASFLFRKWSKFACCLFVGRLYKYHASVSLAFPTATTLLLPSSIPCTSALFSLKTDHQSCSPSSSLSPPLRPPSLPTTPSSRVLPPRPPPPMSTTRLRPSTFPPPPSPRPRTAAVRSSHPRRPRTTPFITRLPTPRSLAPRLRLWLPPPALLLSSCKSDDDVNSGRFAGLFLISNLLARPPSPPPTCYPLVPFHYPGHRA